ncbi:hypothetical protein EJ07DRAFT_160401 [Lizonia empirigonia]|nr:hypothetical protein EJ07DRAFT_160401 [Lizonia empirigonia]
MDNTQSASPFIVRQENKPLGEPKKILTVFYQDGKSYVEVNMARDYERAEDWRVHEYLPLTFDVGEFRQRFSRSKHGEVIRELDKRVAELDKDRSEGKATVTTWFERFSDLLQPILGCLPFEVKNHLADGFQEDESDHHDSTDSDTNDCKACSRALEQSIILQRTSTGESTHQVVPAQRTDMCISQAAASIILTPSNSTEKPIPSPTTPLLTIPSTIRANTAISAEDTVLWIESSKAFSGIGFRAQKML